MKFPDYEKLSNEEFHKQVDVYWNVKANQMLVGRKIVKAEYMTKKECDEMMWYDAPVCMQLDNGIWLYPSQDDEGNNGGALFTSHEKDNCLPTMSV